MEGIRFALNICADVWEPETARQARDAGAQVLLVLNASPYAIGKLEWRHRVIRERIAETGMAVVYANMVGGQDELIFDGGSFAMDRNGELTAQSTVMEEALAILEIRDDLRPAGEIVAGSGERGRCLPRAVSWCARLHRQEPLSGSIAGSVGRNRFRIDTGDRGRCAWVRTRFMQ